MNTTLTILLKYLVKLEDGRSFVVGGTDGFDAAKRASLLHGSPAIAWRVTS